MSRTLITVRESPVAIVVTGDSISKLTTSLEVITSFMREQQRRFNDGQIIAYITAHLMHDELILTPRNPEERMIHAIDEALGRTVLARVEIMSMFDVGITDYRIAIDPKTFKPQKS